MRFRNLLLIVPILTSAECGGRSSIDGFTANVGGGQPFGGAAATGGMIVTGGAHSTGGLFTATGGIMNTGGHASTAVGGTTNFGGTTGPGGSHATGGVPTTGGSWNTGGGACCGAFKEACQNGSFLGLGVTDCPQGAICHVETQYCGVCAMTVGCAVYSDDAAAGGAAASGGTTSTGVDAGTGCTGNFETIQSNTGLCVATMAAISGPEIDAVSANYSIDVTEVTQGQYDAWLATDPALPPTNDANCGYVASYAVQGTGYVGTDKDHHPVQFVDWCDAYAYCAGVGKRLCGGIGGGAVSYADFADAEVSQWYRACTSAGTNAYPYGNSYQPTYCDGIDYWANALGSIHTLEVGSMGTCVTKALGYAGARDLSGNVVEWENSCQGAGSLGLCRIRGGSFSGDNSYLPCASDDSLYRDDADRVVGFRCCSP